MKPSAATPIAPKTPPIESQRAPQEPICSLTPHQHNVANKIRQLLIYSAHEVVVITEEGQQKSISKENLCWVKTLTTAQFIAYLHHTHLLVSQEEGEYKLTALPKKTKKPNNFSRIVVSSAQPSSSSPSSSSSTPSSAFDTAPPFNQGSDALLKTSPQTTMTDALITAIANDAISKLSTKSKQILQNMGQDAALQELLLKQLEEVTDIFSLWNVTDLSTIRKRLILGKNIGIALNQLLHNLFMADEGREVFYEVGIKSIIEDTIDDTLDLPKKPANATRIMYRAMFGSTDKIQLKLTKNQSQEEAERELTDLVEPALAQESGRRKKIFASLIKSIIDDAIKDTGNKSTTHSQQKQSDATTIPSAPSHLTMNHIQDIAEEVMKQLSPGSKQILQNMERNATLQTLILEELKKVPEIHSFVNKTDFLTAKKFFPLEERIGIVLNKLLHNKIMVDPKRNVFDEVGIKSIIDDAIEDALHLQKRTSNATRIVYRRILDLSPEDQLALINNRPQEEMAQILTRLINLIDSSLKQPVTTTKLPHPSSSTMEIIRPIVKAAMLKLSPKSLQILQSMKRDTTLQKFLTQQLIQVPEIHAFANKTHSDLSILEEFTKKCLTLEESIGINLDEIILNKIMVDPKRNVFDEVGIKTMIDEVIENTLQEQQKQSVTVTISSLRSKATIGAYALILAYSLEKQLAFIRSYPQGVAPLMIDKLFQVLVTMHVSDPSR